MSPATPAIAVCIQNQQARLRVREALHALSHRLVDNNLPDGLGGLAGCRAVIYDLLPVERGSDLVAALRRHHPTISVLLYVPLEHGILRSAVTANRGASVAMLEQEEGPREFERLVSFLRGHLTRVPEEIAAALLDLALGEHDRVRRFVRAVLARRAGGVPSQRCTVAFAAADMRLKRRTLYKAWPGEPVPPPKELLDWTTVVLVTFTAQWAEISINRAAGECGLDPERWRSLRERLCPREGLGRLPPSQALDLLILRLAERCRLSREAAVRMQEIARMRETA